MKKEADKKCKPLQLEIGDMVLVKLQPHRQHSVLLRRNQKLSLRYFGPFPVIEKIGEVAYKLLLPPSTKIYPIFHCSQLKLCKGDHVQPYIPLPITNSDVGSLLQPEAILNTRVINRNQQHVQQHLIKWEGMDKTQATWEDTTVIKQVFPDFNLEDKVAFKGEGSVTKVVVERAIAEKKGIIEKSREGKRCSARPKIANSKWVGFEWFRY